MLLPQQIQAILYHVMMGWFYGCVFSFLCSLRISVRFVKGFMETLYHIVFIILSFYGLYTINGGVTNIYLIGFFLFGIVIFYKLYLPVFMEGVIWLRHLVRPIKLLFLKWKKCSITLIKEVKKKKMQKKQVRKAERKQRRTKKQEAI